MANEVLFKRGTQAALNALRTGNSTTAVDGAFYLTTDTNRLYIGKNIAASGNTPVIQPVPVNEGVTVVTNVSDLPAVANTAGGEFYYVTSQNILCVSSGDGAGTKAWVQINPDTDTAVSDFEISSAASGGVVTVTQTISTTIDEGGTTSSGDSYPDTMAFVGDNGIDVSLGAAQGDHNKIIIEGEKTTLGGAAYTDTNSGTNGAKINLTSDKHDSTAHDRDSSVILMPGNGMTMSTSNNTITFTCTVPTLDGGQVTVSPGNGTAGNTIGFTIYVEDAGGNTAYGSVDPTIQLGDHSNALIHFDNGKATLPVYTKDEVDSRIKDFDAMTYRGTLGTTGSVQNISIGGTASSGVITSVDVGDTFKVSGGLSALSSILKDSNGKLYGLKTSASDTTHNDIELRDGDLLIAQGTEGSDGHITAASLKFDYVPSANDYDSQYKGVTIDNGIEFEEVGGNGIGGIAIAIDPSNDCIIATDDQTAGTERVTNTVTLKHKETFSAASSWVPAGDDTNGKPTNRRHQQEATGQTLCTYLDIQVPQIAYDKAGHITGITAQTYRVCDTFGDGTAIDDLIVDSVSTSGNNTQTPTYSADALIKLEMTLSNGDSDDVSMHITSSSLYMAKSQANDDLIIDVVWGTF